MEKVTVVSLGGSIISPDAPDTQFLSRFVAAMENYLADYPEAKVIIVTGGGAPARLYQQAYKTLCENPSTELLDWIGVAATALNGELLRALFFRYTTNALVTDPTAPIDFSGRVLIASGWKPGFSSDADAVFLAKRFGSSSIINLSNIAKVYTADPKIDPNAQALDTISWSDFREMVGDKWTPGKNLPFDPIASKEAHEANIQVICADGRDIENTFRILRNESYIGTLIS